MEWHAMRLGVPAAWCNERAHTVYTQTTSSTPTEWQDQPIDGGCGKAIVAELVEAGV